LQNKVTVEQDALTAKVSLVGAPRLGRAKVLKTICSILDWDDL
jgi:hypothetical protein